MRFVRFVRFPRSVPSVPSIGSAPSVSARSISSVRSDLTVPSGSPLAGSVAALVVVGGDDDGVADVLGPGEGAPLVGVSFRHVTEVATHWVATNAGPPTTRRTAC
ncbi:hypothetical protein [Streptomyces sp. NPDC054958]